MKARPSLLKIIRDAIIYGGLGLGCIAGAKFVTNPTWHDSLLIIGGVLLGGLCAMLALLKIALKAKTEDHSTI